MRLTFLYPLFGLSCGILISDVLEINYGIILIIIGASIIFWALLHYVSTNPLLSRKYGSLHSVWITMLFLGIGALDYEANCRFSIDREISDEKVQVKGVIEEAQPLAKGDRFKLKILSLKNPKGEDILFRNLRFLLITDGLCATKGDIVEFSCVPYSFPENSNLTSGNSTVMKHQGIHYKADVKSDNIDKRGKLKSPSVYLNDLRNDLIIMIEKSSLSKHTKHFVISVILGEKNFISSKSRETLSSAGLAHIIALSGLHIGIIYTIFLILLFPLSLLGKPGLRKSIAIAFVWIYVIISGGAPSTVRAAIMATLIVLAYILQRKNSSLNGLFIAAFIILLLQPFDLWDIGFQLSFICVASILLFGEKLNPVNHHFHPYLYKATSLCLITLITTIATSLLIIYYFKEIPLLFLPANYGLLPLLPVFFGFSLLYIGFLVLGLDIKILSTIIDWFYNKFFGLADFLSMGRSSKISLEITPLSVVFWLSGFLFLSLLIHSRNKNIKRLYLSLSSLSVMVSIILIIIGRPEQQSYLRFQHSFTSMTAQMTHNNEILDLDFPRNSISHVQVQDIQIFAIDNKIKNSRLDKIKETGKERKNYLFIGPKADYTQIAEILENIPVENIILHANIGSRMNEELLEKISPVHHEKIHSLRERGSFELDF